MKKTMTFAVLHFTVAFTVAYALTGSWIIGGAMALIEPAINTVAFFFHEKAWQRWGSQQNPNPKENHQSSAPTVTLTEVFSHHGLTH